MTSRITTDGADPGARLHSSAPSRFAAVGGSALIAALLIMATIGLTTLSSRASRPGAGADVSREPGSGLVVRSELVDAWLPPSLDQLVGLRASTALALSDEDLRCD